MSATQTERWVKSDFIASQLMQSEHSGWPLEIMKPDHSWYSRVSMESIHISYSAEITASLNAKSLLNLLAQRMPIHHYPKLTIQELCMKKTRPRIGSANRWLTHTSTRSLFIPTMKNILPPTGVVSRKVDNLPFSKSNLIFVWSISSSWLCVSFHKRPVPWSNVMNSNIVIDSFLSECQMIFGDGTTDLLLEEPGTLWQRSPMPNSFNKLVEHSREDADFKLTET